jgi:heptosyltransferase I
VVRTLPAATALRAACPGAHLAWLVEPAAAAIVRAQPWLDEVLVFPRPRLREGLRRGRVGVAARALASFLRELRAPRFDLVVDFHAILKSGVLGWLSAAPRRVSYARPFAREGAGWFATERARLEPSHMSRFARNEGLVRYLGVGKAPAARPLVLPAAAARAAAEALGEGPAPVILHPGTSDATAHKRWAPAGFVAVARALAEGDGVPCRVTAGPAREEQALAQEVVEASGGAARLAPETPTLVELAALLAVSRLYIGSDTGPMHLASLVGTPVVQLLGPTDPVENAPYEGTASRTVRVQVGCNPCRRGCATATCMRVIAPERVLEAARALLATSPRRMVECAGPQGRNP